MLIIKYILLIFFKSFYTYIFSFPLLYSFFLDYIKYFHGKLLLRCMTSNLNAVNSSENENNTKNIKQKILEASLPFVVSK